MAEESATSCPMVWAPSSTRAGHTVRPWTRRALERPTVTEEHRPPAPTDPLAAPRRSGGARGGAGSSGARQHRRSVERSRRRRRRLQRSAVLLVLVLLAAAAYLGVSRIRWGAGGSAATSTTLAGSAVGDAVLLSITQDDQTRVAVLIAPSAQPTLLVALPGDVLIRASTGFDPLRVFLDGPDEEATFQKAAEGLESMLGTRPVARADIQWSDLLKAVSSVGAGSTAPADLRSDDAKDAAVVADVLKALLAAVGTAPGDAALAALSVNGDRDAARAALRALGGAAAVSGAVPGRLVEGLGFAYFEPDVAGPQALLGGLPPSSYCPPATPGSTSAQPST